MPKTKECEDCIYLREVLIKEHLTDLSENIKVSMCVKDPDGLSFLQAERIKGKKSLN